MRPGTRSAELVPTRHGGDLPQSTGDRRAQIESGPSQRKLRTVGAHTGEDPVDEMIKTLTRKYNRARQAQITKEIAEVVGGADALK